MRKKRRIKKKKAPPAEPSTESRCGPFGHSYPYYDGQPVKPGTKCRCGARTWGPLKTEAFHDAP